MSGAPKRSHEESGHSSYSKYPHEDSGTYPKLPPSVSNEYHQPYEMGQDSRLTKIPRTESRDADRRSPLHSIYRMPSASNDLHVDHPPASENRLESRDSKDTRDLRFENRDKKTETREPYSEVRRDTPNAKVEKDVRHDSRGDDNKEVKSERENYNDAKADLKAEGYGVASSHLNYKESKEYHRGKRYSDAPVGSTDTWHRSTSQGHVEVGKEVPTTEERDHVEAHEAVGENRYDSKGDDKFKDKDRKRKDIKHRDWGERDKERSDRRSNVQVANSSSDCKDSAKEERDAERWERERRDTAKDKEILKERERDHTKRDTWSGVEKDSSNTEKEVGDGSIRMPEHETLPPEQKKQKDFESWRTADRESRDRRKERDVDAEGDRPEKRIRGYDKESDDGGADGEAATDKEREVYNYGVQQRKRMQRSRAAPANRELRFRSHTQDNEGSQGKAEVSSVVYKVGECMQELIKLWKEHEASPAEKNGETSVTGPTLEIRIPSEHVTATNRQVRGGQLWGTDIYTDDSDLVAVLMHTGYCRPTASPPPSAIQELRATVRILPPQDCYISTLRNNVRSRAWGAAIGCSYRVERCCIVKKAGGSIDLEPCLTHTSTVEPTLAPVVVERTMTTRAAASNALRQQRFVREVTIQYNLCNEPWIKYSISIVADKGLKKTLYTSARLKKGEVLYLETHSCRYELCFNGEKIIKASQLSQMHEGENEKNQNHASHSTNGERNDSENIIVDVFRWSRCKTPLPQKVMRSVGIPLPLEHVEVLEENLDWEDVQWSQTGVWIAGKEEVATIAEICAKIVEARAVERCNYLYAKIFGTLSSGRANADLLKLLLREVRGGQLWGTDIYTDDSDLVAGYCRPTASPPPSAIQELRATVRILPPKDCYISTLRNNVRSRAWGAAMGCSYRVERCCIVKKAGGSIDLEPCLTHTSTVEPTLAPVVERTMTTRAAASNALRQQRFVREVTIQYNLCKEPWIKYSISIVADKGLKKTLYTSARLKKGEVLYLETHSCRYELCFNGEKIIKASQLSQMHEGENEKNHNHASHSTNGERNDSENIIVDVFRWSRCKTPLPQKVMRSVGIPLPLEYVEVLEENLDWEDVQWSQTGVWIAGKEYSLARVHFLSVN